MLRRSIAIAFLTLLFFNWYGYRLLSDFLQNRSDIQLEAKLDQNDYEEFLAHVPAMKVGDTFDLHFTKGAAKIVANGDTIGHIDHPKFAEALLLAFLGPNPGNPEVQSGLLGNSR